LDLACLLSLSKKRELSNISVRSNKNGDNNNASVDELFTKVNSRVVVQVLVRNVDQDISSAEVISESVDVLAVNVAEVSNFAIVFRKSLDNWLIDVAQERTSWNRVDCLCEFKVAKSRVRHISMISDSNSVA